MAVYTDVSEGELRLFLEGYDLGTLISFKGIAEGVENSNFLLVTAAGTFILTLYEKRVAREDLPFFVGLMDHLASAGFPCPRPVRKGDGEALGELKGRAACIVTFLDGTWSREASLERLAQVGKAAARLHQAAADFRLARRNALDLSGWLPLVETALSRADTVESGMAELIETELRFQEANAPSGLPSGIVHADLFPDNVFFVDERFSGVIDFYFSCNDHLAWEIAILLNAWCFDADRDWSTAKGDAVLEGYESVRPLEAAEREALPVLCRGAAFRFLLTRLNDWLDHRPDALVRPHDPVPFARRLRHWRRA